MTLRTRLIGAFVIVVLAPVLVGAIFVTIAGRAAGHAREQQRLDVAVTALSTTIGATCARMQSTAESAATMSATGGDTSAASSVVGAGRASAILIDPVGAPAFTTNGAPAFPWALCNPVPSAAVAGGPGQADRAIAAAVQVRDTSGTTIGYVYAAQALDRGYLGQLSSAVGAGVTLRSDPAMSTEPANAARRLATDATTEDGKVDDRLARSVAPLAGQPLAFVLSVPMANTGGRSMIVLSIVLAVAVVAVVAAWVLARGTTRPLDELTEAADRMAGGALDTRVPVRHGDEVGQLGAAFNRMTREMQTYVEALAASRGQLRGNLNVLGDTLSSTHDLPRILRVILDSAIAATGAARGAVLLVDGPRGRLAVQCSEGFDAYATEELEEAAISSGDGLLGSVAATGVARRGRLTADGPELAAGEPRCGTYLVVPLKLPADGGAAGPATTGAAESSRNPTPGRVRGVLALYDGLGDGEFDATDERTVQAFAGHAAVAVDNVRLHDEARRLSHTDPLTSLYNYRYLREVLGREISRSKRFGHSLCVMLLDLDRFKDVNDSYGHAAGDAVLAEFAGRITDEIRGVDLAFRAGGEEFVLVLPETALQGGKVLAQRLVSAIRDAPMTVPDALAANADLKTVEMPVVARVDDGAAITRQDGSRASAAVPPRHHVRIPITVSIGVAVFPEHGATGAQVLAAADAALYAAKEAGRDTYRLARAHAADATERPAGAYGARGPADVSEAPGPADSSQAPRPPGVRPRRGADDEASEQPPGGASTTGPPTQPAAGR